MELFRKKVNSFQPLHIIVKSSASSYYYMYWHAWGKTMTDEKVKKEAKIHLSKLI